MQNSPQWNVIPTHDMTGFEFVARTPANGDAYFNKDKDIAIVVYRNKILINTNRTKGRTGNTASCFNDCKEISNRLIL